MEKPVCLISNDGNGHLLMQPSALQLLQKIQQPVVVVAVVGLYRTGKSYLLNLLAGKQTGFALGSTVESKTKGIWMWCIPHPTKAGTTLVLLDTEGLGDVDKADVKNDTHIFCLAVLLSSTFVLNSRGTIDNRAIEELQYVTELSEYIKVKSCPGEEDDSEFVSFFPKFVWAVRDFTLESKINDAQVTDDQYLEFALKLKAGTARAVKEFNLPRECIRNYFPSRKCFTFPFPCSPDDVSRLEHLDPGDLSPEFQLVTDCFCRYIFAESDAKKLNNGHPVTGRVLGGLANLYVETISSGTVPCLDNAVIAMAQIENDAAVKEGLEVYQSGMEKLKISFPLMMNDMISTHQRLSNTATQTFMSRSFKDSEGIYLGSFQKNLNRMFEDYLCLNDKASKQKCEDLLSTLSLSMMEKLKNGFYTKPGGHELFSQDLQYVVKEFKAYADKGEQAESTLEEFLKQRSVNTAAILQADSKLTQKEKEILEEKQKAILLTQEINTKDRKQQQLKEKIEAERHSNEERVRMLKQKVDEEMKLQREEVERAIESKLREQAALLEKGFQDKADMMNREIQAFKKKEKKAEEKSDMLLKNLMENLNKRHSETMKEMMRRHDEQMKAIRRMKRPSPDFASPILNLLLGGLLGGAPCSRPCSRPC